MAFPVVFYIPTRIILVCVFVITEVLLTSIYSTVADNKITFVICCMLLFFINKERLCFLEFKPLLTFNNKGLKNNQNLRRHSFMAKGHESPYVFTNPFCEDVVSLFTFDE